MTTAAKQSAASLVRRVVSAEESAARRMHAGSHAVVNAAGAFAGMAVRPTSQMPAGWSTRAGKSSQHANGDVTSIVTSAIARWPLRAHEGQLLPHYCGDYRYQQVNSFPLTVSR